MRSPPTIVGAPCRPRGRPVRAPDWRTTRRRAQRPTSSPLVEAGALGAPSRRPAAKRSPEQTAGWLRTDAEGKGARSGASPTIVGGTIYRGAMRLSAYSGGTRTLQILFVGTFVVFYLINMSCLRPLIDHIASSSNAGSFPGIRSAQRAYHRTAVRMASGRVVRCSRRSRSSALSSSLGKEVDIVMG
jgi:hypothetical protein